MTNNLLVLLRSLKQGYSTVFVNEDGRYISKQVDSVQTYSLHEGCEEKTIESRLQLELYGEYPLSPLNKADWEIVKKAFKLNES